MVLYRQDFFLDDLVRELITDLSVNLKQPLVLNDCTPIMISADREKIEQVLGNLIGNALKYSISNEPVLLDVSNEEGRVTVKVHDRGIGISNEDKLHLFDRFFRSENPDSRTVSGFGIGLYVSAEIVRLHGGNIGVDSEIGQGSTFWFDLPAGTTIDTEVKKLVGS
jgi:signal transduction histidine kinase